MKARYQYRFYPTDQQRLSDSQLFGCVRVVGHDALAFCKSAEKLPTYNQLSARLTSDKKTPDREFMNDVYSVCWYPYRLDEASRIPVLLGSGVCQFYIIRVHDRQLWLRRIHSLRMQPSKIKVYSWFGELITNLDWQTIVTSVIVSKLPLNVREWDCPNCQTHHDRDINVVLYGRVDVNRPIR